MKKVLAVVAALALTLISSVAMAEVNVSGSIDIRNLSTQNTTDWNSKNSDENRTTQERIRVNIDAKNDNVKGRVTFENDWDVWGRVEAPQANGATTTNAGGGRLEIREGWIDFTIPGAGPAHVKVGHQFLQLGNGWFFRSMKYGSDAWVVGYPGTNTVAFVDVKVAENLAAASDDVDAFVLLDNYKLNDKSTVCAYLVYLRDPQGKFTGSGDESNLDNIGLWFNGVLGPVNLQAEVDVQMGTVKFADGSADRKFKGNQIVLEANMTPAEGLKVEATVGTGTGQDTSNDYTIMKTALDADPHYTFVYEYFMKTAAGAKNTGFANTLAVGVGASYEINKMVGVDLKGWMLQANEDVALNGGTPDSDLGTEIDARLRLKLYEQLSWSFTYGHFMPGKAYEDGSGVADNVDAIQGVLSYKF